MHNQKQHSHGTDGNRYFWNIKTDTTEGEYRSRCATAKGVKEQLKKNGHTGITVKMATA